MPLPSVKRIPFDDEEGAKRLAADGWREIEVLETWETGKSFVRPALRSDLPAVVAIAGEVFTYDRLHADREVANEDASAVKAEFARAAFDDRIRMIHVHGEPVDGFLISRLKGQHLIIDLVGVKKGHRGNGIAGQMIREAAKDADWIVAGTQSTNEPARHLYASLGMKIVKRERTYHR